jgi:hypothetical protein
MFTTGMDGTSSNPIFSEKKNQPTHHLICLHFNHHGDQKSRLKFIYPKTHFSTCFLVKTHIKRRRNHDKFIYDLKKSFQEPKSTRARIYFFTNFKGKKTPNMNSPHQMKSLDTNIVCFGGLN